MKASDYASPDSYKEKYLEGAIKKSRCRIINNSND